MLYNGQYTAGEGSLRLHNMKLSKHVSEGCAVAAGHSSKAVRHTPSLLKLLDGDSLPAVGSL